MPFGKRATDTSSLNSLRNDSGFRAICDLSIKFFIRHNGLFKAFFISSILTVLIFESITRLFNFSI